MANVPDDLSFIHQWTERRFDDSPEAVQWKEETIGNILDNFGAQLLNPNIPLADVHAIFVLTAVQAALNSPLPVVDINLENMDPVFGPPAMFPGDENSSGS